MKRPVIRSTRASALAILAAATLAVLGASCKRKPEITCKVNDQCFVCPDEKARVACFRDPTSSRCKWAEPSHCKPPEHP